MLLRGFLRCLLGIYLGGFGIVVGGILVGGGLWGFRRVILVVVLLGLFGRILCSRLLYLGFLGGVFQ